MNKKIVIFLVLALAALSVMAVSVWGTIAESDDLPSITSIDITGYDSMNDSGDKIIFVKNVITEDDYMYRINFVINPTDADRESVKARVDVGSGIEAVMSVDDLYAMVIYDLDKIGQSVTITIWDVKTAKEDSVTLLFANADEVDIDDPDIFN